jgi:hypothetical protein
MASYKGRKENLLSGDCYGQLKGGNSLWGSDTLLREGWTTLKHRECTFNMQNHTSSMEHWNSAATLGKPVHSKWRAAGVILQPLQPLITSLHTYKNTQQYSPNKLCSSYRTFSIIFLYFSCFLK